ncbi:MAG: glycosyltransferase family 2 protein [Acidobacteria bacterium]|nr:MAG: glycosyltransferase family 2 protein [Acidobacteriota bacterium]
MASPFTAIVLTHNEARNIGACLASLAGLPQAVFVVDSGSADDTVAIARAAGAVVVSHPFEGHARQWNWALETLPIVTDWVLCLDADHRVTPELADELTRLFDGGPDGPVLSGVDGWYINRRQIFRGHWIRHGGYYPKHLLKLVRRGRAWSDERERLDFRLYVKGATATLRHDIVEDNRNEASLAFWFAKHVRFARLQADEEIARRRDGFGYAIAPSPFGTADQRVLWRKQIWHRLPLFVRPGLYFSYRYVWQRGFLDGEEGFLFHCFQAFWYRLLVDVLIAEQRLVSRS